MQSTRIAWVIVTIGLSCGDRAQVTSGQAAPVVTPKLTAPPPSGAEPTKAVVVAPETAVQEDPEAPVTPKITPQAPPIQLPAGVYAASIGWDHKEWSVDIITFAGIDITPLEKRIHALEAKGEEAFVDDLKAPDLPVGMALGDPWTLLTLAGNEQRTAKRFDASVSGASSTLHFSVRLGPAQPGTEGHALALRGHASTAARLIAPPAIAPEALAPGTLKRVVGALVPKFDEELRKAARKVKFKESHVKLFPGRFPGGRSHVVFVDLDLPSDEEGWGGNLSGVLFARPDASPEFVTIADVAGSVTLIGLVDSDGDGFDEVIYNDRYHEGSYIEMIYWQDGAPKIETLAGDGA